MDWLAKIPNWVKIPLKILLPALCIFSGFLLLIDDNLAAKLYLKEFRQQSGFAFGIIFLVTLSLILVYLIVFASKPVIAKINNTRYKNGIKKQIVHMQDAEKIIIYGLYNEPTHAFTFPMSDPTVNLLKAKGFVFTYTQEANLLKYFGQTAVIFVLQPIILDCLQEMLEAMNTENRKIEYKLKKCNDTNKKDELQKRLKNGQAVIKNITSISLDKYYKGEY